MYTRSEKPLTKQWIFGCCAVGHLKAIRYRHVAYDANARDFAGLGCVRTKAWALCH